MVAHPSVRLKLSGHIATIEPDPYQDGAFILDVDGTPQSHVFIDEPDELFFEYVRRIGHVIDIVAPEGAPITAVHLGGGGLTLPRFVEATRPGSRQQVIELEQDLIDFVREHLPVQRGATIRYRYGDARAVVLHADEPHTATGQAHHDIRGTGVQGVVHQFAHHRSRSFDHFPRSDLADQLVGQFENGA